jgi:hypothetical protein
VCVHIFFSNTVLKRFRPESGVMSRIAAVGRNNARVAIMNVCDLNSDSLTWSLSLGQIVVIPRVDAECVSDMCDMKQYRGGGWQLAGFGQTLRLFYVFLGHRRFVAVAPGDNFRFYGCVDADVELLVRESIEKNFYV